MSDWHRRFRDSAERLPAPSEPVEWDELPPPEGRKCRWPTCELRSDIHAMVSMDDGTTWFCLIHADNGFLPPLEQGPCGVCDHCGHNTCYWVNDEVLVHPRCLRAWSMGAVSLRERGAYERRASR